MNAGDTGFMLICSALVFFMTPGLAFFYGGLVRRKNVVSTMNSFSALNELRCGYFCRHCIISL